MTKDVQSSSLLDPSTFLLSSLLVVLGSYLGEPLVQECDWQLIAAIVKQGDRMMRIFVGKCKMVRVTAVFSARECER